ncbi:MAG: hypothetical protein M3M98_08520 [Nitrospirota bacterium]|nr:hypothetical protein [Nitrospirota bacterium]
MDALSQAPSWKANVGMQTIRHNGCELCSNGVGNVGVGAAAETQLFKREVYFAFAEAEANYSRAYEERHRVGGGGTVGMLADMTDRWKLMLSVPICGMRSGINQTTSAGSPVRAIPSRRTGLSGSNIITATGITTSC